MNSIDSVNPACQYPPVVSSTVVITALSRLTLSVLLLCNCHLEFSQNLQLDSVLSCHFF